MRNLKQEASELKTALGCDTYEQLASVLGVPISTLNGWKYCLKEPSGAVLRYFKVLKVIAVLGSPELIKAVKSIGD